MAIMKAEKINGRNYFVIDQKDVQPDLIDLRMLVQNEITGLLPCQYIRHEDERYFRYEADGDQTLSEWLSKAQYRKNVMKLLESLIFISEELDAYLLEQTKLCINPDFVMVDGNRCKMAYIPVKERERKTEIWESMSLGNTLQLAQMIVFSGKYAVDEEFTYLFDLQNAFSRKDILTISDMKKWLRIVDGEEKTGGQHQREKSAVSEEREMQINDGAAKIEEKQPASPMRKPGIFNNDVAKAVKQQPVIDRKEKNPFGGAGEAKISEKGMDSLEGLFGDMGFSADRKEEKKNKSSQKAGKEKKKGREQNKEKSSGESREKHGFFARNKKHENAAVEYIQSISAVPSIPESEKEIINHLDYEEMTQLITDGQGPTFVRENSGEEYRLVEEQYVIGSGTQADIVISDNKTVSRQHARIFRKDDLWYIEDMGSTNGTSLNGEALRAGTPYRLEGSAKIRVSNVDWIFYEN